MNRKTFSFDVEELGSYTVYAEPNMAEVYAIDEVMADYYGSHVKLIDVKNDIDTLQLQLKDKPLDSQTVMFALHMRKIDYYNQTYALAYLETMTLDGKLKDISKLSPEKFEKVQRAFEVARDTFLKQKN